MKKLKINSDRKTEYDVMMLCTDKSQCMNFLNDMKN